MLTVIQFCSYNNYEFHIILCIIDVIHFLLTYIIMLYYIVRRASTPMAATSVSQVMGRNEGSISSEGVVPSPMSPPIGLTSSGRFSSSTTVMVLPESASLSDSEEVEEIEFNNQIGGEGCLPNSSYYEEDTLFTWEDITGSVGSVGEGWMPV